MTDNDIIKALECCMDRRCDICVQQCNHFADESICRLDLIEHALHSINRLKTEIERLKKRLEEEKHALFEQQAYTAKLQAENDEFCEIIFTDRSEAIKMLKAEAIKGFAERLKRDITINNTEDGCLIYSIDYGCLMEDIDSLVEEMTEGEA